ncbi:hypothetical protein E2C01_101765 [Portunus trituberculatus]|uniref:Uncharacterized protein n=1 Tax=Portunus trituberculatus TaxID=210409 RepID=A0A5B7KL59_PORTR|nr:hypothetical protein [Portunus trituberculatus]
MCSLCSPSQQVSTGCNSKDCGLAFPVCGVWCGLSPTIIFLGPSDPKLGL